MIKKIRQTSEACFELLKNCYPTRMQDYARKDGGENRRLSAINYVLKLTSIG
ncbi:MAG: hypothetical protein SOZ48_00655 [Eubacterium sp.]|nr:hypothetical protein [Eubacterium sp.]